MDHRGGKPNLQNWECAADSERLVPNLFVGKHSMLMTYCTIEPRFATIETIEGATTISKCNIPTHNNERSGAR